MDEKLIEGYKAFLETGKTERECCERIIADAKAAGYKDIQECTSLKAGDKVYLRKFGKAVALFTVGT